MPKNPSLFAQLDATPMEKRVALLGKAGYRIPLRPLQDGPRPVDRTEAKPYVQGQLTQQMYFLHATAVPPPLVVQAGGLDPAFGQEICFYDTPAANAPPARDVQVVGNRDGQLLLACQTWAPAEVPLDPADPPGSRRVRVSLSGVLGSAGFRTRNPVTGAREGYAYVAGIPATGADPWTFFSPRGLLSSPDEVAQEKIRTTEIAFDRAIPLEYLTALTGYVPRVRDGVKEDTFLVIPLVPWQTAQPEVPARAPGTIGAQRPAVAP